MDESRIRWMEVRPSRRWKAVKYSVPFALAIIIALIGAWFGTLIGFSVNLLLSFGLLLFVGEVLWAFIIYNDERNRVRKIGLDESYLYVERHRGRVQFPLKDIHLVEFEPDGGARFVTVGGEEFRVEGSVDSEFMKEIAEGIEGARHGGP